LYCIVTGSGSAEIDRHKTHTRTRTHTHSLVSGSVVYDHYTHHASHIITLSQYDNILNMSLQIKAGVMSHMKSWQLLHSTTHSEFQTGLLVTVHSIDKVKEWDWHLFL